MGTNCVYWLTIKLEYGSSQCTTPTAAVRESEPTKNHNIVECQTISGLDRFFFLFLTFPNIGCSFSNSVNCSIQREQLSTNEFFRVLIGRSNCCQVVACNVKVWKWLDDKKFKPFYLCWIEVYFIVCQSGRLLMLDPYWDQLYHYFCLFVVFITTSICYDSVLNSLFF